MSNRYSFTLPELTKKFQDASRRISLYRDIPVKQLLFKPDPGRWSAHEVCLHLIAFGESYLQQMDIAITKAKPVPQSDGPFQPRWHFRKMAHFFEPPVKIKTKTFPVFHPGTSEDISQTLDELSDIQANVLYLLDKAKSDRWNLHKIKGKNPAFRILSMTLIELLVLMEVHQRRHFRQIEENFRLFKEK